MRRRDTNEEDRLPINQALDAAAAWALSDDQLCTMLGGLEMAQLRELRESLEKGNIDPSGIAEDLCQRALRVHSIYESLHTLFAESTQADSWIRRPNQGPGFQGRPALELMLGPFEQLDYVCRYLKGWTV